VWYASHAVKEIDIEAIGHLNPSSFLSHRWLSVSSVTEAMLNSLEDKNEWKTLIEQLEQLVIEKEYDKRLDISVLNGFESSQYDDNWENIAEYSKNACADITKKSAKDFENNIKRAFSEDDQPYHVYYREWDGRYYYLNKREPIFIAAAMEQLRQGHKFDLKCKLHVESLHMRSLDRMRNSFWILLMKRESAYLIYQLLSQANLPCQLAEFEWRRNDLCFLIAKKHNMKLNRILLNLLSTHSSKLILDWPKFLSQQNFPFRNR